MAHIINPYHPFKVPPVACECHPGTGTGEGGGEGGGAGAGDGPEPPEESTKTLQVLGFRVSGFEFRV